MSIRCRILRRHAWTDWVPVPFPTLWQMPADSEARLCVRCPAHEHRPAPAPEGADAPAQLPPSPPVPVHEVPDLEPGAGWRLADDADDWGRRFFTSLGEVLPPPYAAAPLDPARVVAPPAFLAEARASLRAAQAARPVEGRSRVVSRDVDEADRLPDGGVLRPASEPDPECQLEATRAMLADLGRQLDEVTAERNALVREREAAWPSPVAELQRDLASTRLLLEEITRDRDRISHVSGERLAEMRLLRGQLAVTLRVINKFGIAPAELVDALLTGPDTAVDIKTVAVLTGPQTDVPPAIPRPDRC